MRLATLLRTRLVPGAWLALGATLLAAVNCTAWRDETKGLAPAASASSTGTAGAGGAGTCLGCNDYFMASSGCEPPGCPSPDDVCDGAARDALDDFTECALCTACSSECADACAAGGGGGSTAMSEACQSCVIGTVTGTCASQYAACSQL